MQIYFIDGYNLIYKVRELENSSRHYYDLVMYIKAHNLTGSKNNKVVVFFDGKSDELFSEREFEIVYSGYQTADEMIKKRIENTKNKKQIVVVSDDREIRDFAKSEGAISTRTSEFLAKAKKEAKRAQANPVSDVHMREITAELEKIWVKK